MKWSARQIILCTLAGTMLLGVAAFSTWRVKLANDVSRQIAAIHAAGLPANGKEADAYYADVPYEANAAAKMGQAFDLMANYSDSRSNDVFAIKFPQRKDVLTPAQMELLAGYCAMNADSLAQAREAIQLPKSRYPMDLSWGAATLLPHLAKIKRLAQIAAFQSLLETNHSAANISDIIGMARTLDAEPLLISKLVRIALLNIAITALERHLNTTGLNDADLSLLGAAFADSAKTNQMAQGFIGERAMYFQYFQMSLAEINRLAVADAADSQEPGGPPLPGRQPAVFKMTGFFERDLCFYLESMETNISLATIFPKNIAMITNCEDQITQNARHHYYILSRMFLPALGTAIFKEATSVAQIRTAQTAIALERFRLAEGKLPASLDELVPQFLASVPADPFDGKMLRYHRSGDGYVIYSIGKDGEDNGGRERPSIIKSSDQTHYDVTFTVER